MLDQVLSLHPRVALRPEPFGAMAYHYDNRRLVFLRHPDIVRVVRDLDGVRTVRAVLTDNEIAENRWPAFTTALTSLTGSEMLHEHHLAR